MTFGFGSLSEEPLGSLDSETIEPGGIASAEGFGSPTLHHRILGTGIASGEAFGTPGVGTPVLDAGGIASAEAFGAPTLHHRVLGGGIPSAEAFGTAHVAFPVYPTGILSAEAFGAPVLQRRVHATGIPSAEVFGTASLGFPIYPEGIASAEAFGDLDTFQGFGGIPSGEAFGVASLVHRITATGIASAEAVGSPRPAPVLHPGGGVSQEAFGHPHLALVLGPTGIPSAEAFGGASTAGDVTPTGIPSAEAFGAHRVNQRVFAESFGGEAFGVPNIARGIRPAGIASAEAFGVPELGTTAELVVVLAEAEQRNLQSFLVDVEVTLYHPSDPSLGIEVEYSTQGASGPWSTAHAQPLDWRHTVGAGPYLMDPVAAVAPGSLFRYVWNAFHDLPEGTFTVYLRLTLGGAYHVIGPIEVTTEIEEALTPADRRRERARALASAGDFLGFGLTAPFERVSRDFRAQGGVELIRSSIREILLTRAAVGRFPGDLPWRPDFGCKLWTLRHAPKAVAAGLAQTYVREAFRWEPRARLTGVEIMPEPMSGPNELQVLVRYQVIAENVEDNRVVLPEFEEQLTFV